MPSNDWRRPSRSDSRLLVMVLAPVAVICIFSGLAGVIKGVWLPGLGFLAAGCVAALLFARHVRRLKREK